MSQTLHQTKLRARQRGNRVSSLKGYRCRQGGVRGLRAAASGTTARNRGAKHIERERLARSMEGAKKPRRRHDILTLLYILYIAFFLSLFAWSFLTFGFRLITLAFLTFILVVIIAINITSSAIYHG